ncbi:hypothetical protein HP532_13625 [Pseudomonas sp. CrR25]|nr:hypothetical protein [Pseudomonas sp. CrR25]
MVGRAGQASAWPVTSDAGISTPVRSATQPSRNERLAAP